MILVYYQSSWLVVERNQQIPKFKRKAGEKVFEVKVFDHQVGRTFIKKCYEGKDLDEIKKEWRFEKTWHYNKQLDDITDDVKELWWEEGRGFYSVVLGAGPREVCQFNVPTDVKMIKRSKNP